MDKAKLLIVISALVLISALIFAFLFSPGKVSYSPQETLEQCNKLVYNGENKINMVFFADKETAGKYSQVLLSTEPFKKNAASFNFYYIDSFAPECRLYNDIALFCYSRELLKKASSCPNDYIIVVQKADKKIRSSSYMNVLSINAQNPISVISHEFGHAFATLADEYVPSKIPKGAENCVSECAKLPEQSTCFLGCSKADYYRSVNSGLMRTLSSKSYGVFDEQLIEEKIKKQSVQKITGSAVSEGAPDCQHEKYYLVEADYAPGTIIFTSLSIEEGCIGSNGAGPFNYSLLMEDGAIKGTGEFNSELIFTDAQEEGRQTAEGEAVENKGAFFLKIPVIEKAKSIEISADAAKLSVSLEKAGAYPCRQ